MLSKHPVLIFMAFLANSHNLGPVHVQFYSHGFKPQVALLSLDILLQLNFSLNLNVHSDVATSNILKIFSFKLLVGDCGILTAK
ncbi:MAG: hypothetical protein EOP34_08180 [Rickettsiales bacterium]|nr:MAG: hypothetical protein EOP34_08180 [Rickettsiales bacterium]